MGGGAEGRQEGVSEVVVGEDRSGKTKRDEEEGGRRFQKRGEGSISVHCPAVR